MKQPIGTFLLIGADIEPRVAILGTSAHEALMQGLAVVSKYQRDDERGKDMRSDQYSRAFGVKGVQYAVPAWSRECMTAIAKDYRGPHEQRVRWLAAKIALGETFGADEWDAFKDGKGGNGRGPRGGQKAKLVPEKPRRPPGGAAAELLFGDKANLAAEREIVAIEGSHR